jgi:hypothetical protein
MATKKNTHLGAELGAGAVAAAALALAGGYVLWERMGKERQAKVKTWAVQARKESVRKLALARSMSEAEYKRIVDQAVKHYGSLAKINKPELTKAATDMKAEWKRIQAQAKLLAKEMQKVKATVRKPAVRKRKTAVKKKR